MVGIIHRVVAMEFARIPYIAIVLLSLEIHLTVKSINPGHLPGQVLIQVDIEWTLRLGSTQGTALPLLADGNIKQLARLGGYGLGLIL